MMLDHETSKLPFWTHMPNFLAGFLAFFKGLKALLKTQLHHNRSSESTEKICYVPSDAGS